MLASFRLGSQEKKERKVKAMATAISQLAFASACALLFMFANLALGKRTSARVRLCAGWVLAVLFLLPVKLPFWRFTIEADVHGTANTPPTQPPMGTGAGIETPVLPNLPSEAPSGTVCPAPDITAILAFIYIAGVLIALLYTFWCYCRATKRLIRCGSAPSERENAIFLQLCEKQKLARAPKLLVCPQNAIGSSLMFGFTKQTVLIADNLSEEDFTLILGHELTHCKHKDSLFKALLALLGAFYWFNPIIHLFIRTMNEICEEACDEKFLCGSSDESKMQYCRLLISIAARKNRNKIFLTSFKGGKKAMKRRLQNILNTKSKVITAILVLSVLLVTMLTSAIYFTLPQNNVKVAYLDSWDKVWSSLHDKDTVKNDFTVEYEYSLDSDIINVTGAVNGKAFEVSGKLAYANHNGAKLFYDFTEDQKGNYNVKHLSIQLAQYTKIDGEKFGAPEGYNWDHSLKAFFETYAKENPKYKNMLALYLNPVDTDDIVVIEVFIEEDFLTQYSEKHDVIIQKDYNAHLNWFVYWYAENGAFELDENLTPPPYITIDKKS